MTAGNVCRMITLPTTLFVAPTIMSLGAVRDLSLPDLLRVLRNLAWNVPGYEMPLSLLHFLVPHWNQRSGTLADPFRLTSDLSKLDRSKASKPECKMC